jgi:colicin import membrane protein
MENSPPQPASAESSPEAQQPQRRLTKAERKAEEEKRKRAAARTAAKRGPKVAPKMGKFVADREKADEQLRTMRLFKEFAQRGKVPSTMFQQLTKELFKGVCKETVAAQLAGLAKETFPPLAAKDSRAPGLTAGDFSGWYFGVAWPAILEARQAEKSASAEAEKAEAAEAAEAAEKARKAREAEEEAAKEAVKAKIEAKARAEAEAAEAKAKKLREEARQFK